MVELPQATMATIAIELSLLLYDLANSLRLRPQSGKGVVITVGRGTAVSKAAVRRDAAGTLFFELGRNQAEFLHSVILRTHRDGAAEASHVHVEGMEAGDHFDLTVMVEVYREPMTADEARKRVGA